MSTRVYVKSSHRKVARNRRFLMLVTFLFVSCEVFFLFKPSRTGPNGVSTVVANISVCVPCIPADIRSGDVYSMLQSIRQQDVLPSEVIIALSSSTEAFANAARKNLAAAVFPVPLVLTSVSFRRTPGENRNRAMEHAKGDIITFFDADDLMHTSRIKVLAAAFTENPHLQLALHGLQRRQQVGRRRFSYWYVRKFSGESLCEMERETRMSGQAWISSRRLWYEITHGHSTIRRGIAERFRFGDRMVGEDCMFVRSILRKLCSSSMRNSQSVLIDSPLSKYSPRATRSKQA